MTEQEFSCYFKTLAQNHKAILHSSQNNAFFYIETLDELTDFDEALRTMEGNVAMLLIANQGELSDANTNSYLDTIGGQLYILFRKRDDISIVEINTQAKQIIKDVFARVRKEHNTKFRINELPYQKVGPMNLEWYGYTAMFTFRCPFGFSVDCGTWLDK